MRTETIVIMLQIAQITLAPSPASVHLVHWAMELIAQVSELQPITASIYSWIGYICQY